MRTPRRSLYVYGIIVLGALSYFIYAEPMNVNDNLTNILHFELRNFAEVVAEDVAPPQTPGRVAWRPGYFLITDLLQKLASGHEHAFYKTLQILLIAGAGLIFLGLLQIRTWPDFAAGTVALLVVLGHHTLDGAVEAIYPINPFAFVFFIQTFVLRALLTDGRSAWHDVAVVTLCLIAMLITELGAIIGVTYIVGALLRLPGASLRAAAGILVLYALLVLVRFIFMTDLAHVSAITLRSENMLLRLAAPTLSFLISDPRGVGFTFVTVAKLMNGELWAAIYLAGSIMLTTLVLVWSLRSAFRRDRASSDDWKVAALLLASLLPTSVFALASQKEYLAILSLPLYAFVAYRALRWAAEWMLEAGTGWHAASAIAVAAILVAISATWSIRTAGLFYHLRAAAFSYQEEWAFDMQRLGRMERYRDARSHAIADRLRSQALATPLNQPAYLWPPAIDLLLRGRGCPAIC